jgi:hypothetical protein
MIRTLAKAFTMSVLAFVLAVPVGAIASNGSEVIIGNSESGEVFTMQPNWLANEKDLKALDAKLAMVKSDLNQKVARVESTLRGQIASLKRELQELRARAESKGMESRTEPNGNGEPGMGKPSSKANGSNLSALNARIAEIEKSLNEMVAKVKELRATVQDLQVRADSKNRLARTGR